MSKPKTIQDLIEAHGASNQDVEMIAQCLFDGTRVFAGPNGYFTTATAYYDLPIHVRDFIRKAIRTFTVENVLDATMKDDSEDNRGVNHDDEI